MHLEVGGQNPCRDLQDRGLRMISFVAQHLLQADSVRSGIVDDLLHGVGQFVAQLHSRADRGRRRGRWKLAPPLEARACRRLWMPDHVTKRKSKRVPPQDLPGLAKVVAAYFDDVDMGSGVAAPRDTDCAFADRVTSHDAILGAFCVAPDAEQAVP